MKNLLKTFLVYILIFASSSVLAQEGTHRVVVLGLLPLSGAEARQGELAQRGLELGLSKFGNVQVLFEDTKSETMSALSAYQRAKAIHPILAVITLGSPTSVALAPLVNKDNIILLAMAATPAYSSPDDFTFRIIGSALQEAAFLSQTILSKLNKKRLSIIYSENDYGVGLVKALKSQLPKDIEIMGEEAFLPGASDYRTQLLRLKAKNPELLYIASWARDAGTILSQAKKMKFQTTYLCAQACLNPDLIAAGQGDSSGLLVSAPINDLQVDIEKEYQERFHEPSTFVVTHMFSALETVSRAFRACEDTKIELMTCVFDQFYQRGRAVSLPLTFDRNGDIGEKYSLKIISGGKFEDYRE
jgi:branched-chain amino acid transport system substrate-binding protein